jgi:hypothetical protein
MLIELLNYKEEQIKRLRKKEKKKKKYSKLHGNLSN